MNITEKKGMPEVTIFFSTAQEPLVGEGLLINEASHSHSDTHHSVGLLCTSDQPVAETDIHVTGGIRTNNPSKRVAVEWRLIPHIHWDRPKNNTLTPNQTKKIYNQTSN